MTIHPPPTGMTMTKRSPLPLAMLAAATLVAGCSSKSNRNDAYRASSTPAATNTSNGTIDSAAVPTHHSKMKGALLGGAAGAVIGGKKGAVLGAAVGAEAQHHRNKVERQRAGAGY